MKSSICLVVRPVVFEIVVMSYLLVTPASLSKPVVAWSRKISLQSLFWMRWFMMPSASAASVAGLIGR